MEAETLKIVFEHINLSKNEQEIVGFLLEYRRPMRAREIALEVEIPRQTAYSILRGMASRGLLVQTDLNGVKHFYLDPKELANYIDLERDKLLKAKQALRGDVSYLVKNPEPFGMPHIHFYEGAIGLRKLFESILDVYKKGKSKRFRGYGINQFSDSRSLNDYLRYFVKKRGSYGVKTQLFIATGADDFRITDEKNALGRIVKHIDIDPQLAGVYFVADRAYLFSYKDNIGVMIENQAIVTLLKDAFDDHWHRVKM